MAKKHDKCQVNKLTPLFHLLYQVIFYIFLSQATPLKLKCIQPINLKNIKFYKPKILTIFFKSK
ncbi:hypothetical protein HNQ88_002858 [Aureibacter tunicatorum]|uniref:Uncharacterized protein n=1 Tax=Aureibacter tunicatorum TaxID=866807 RepID=A0AAE3XNM1_9BACT|nr:hypothetical protein [Aureibacter tunicatorum]BDD04285.1 hypothetical protein AUTU_17680 [Aureibacter tunicatorum]